MGLRELVPLFCGCEDCDSGHSYGPAIRDYYIVHHIRSGAGRFDCAGRGYTLTGGQCFLICPGEVTYYQADGGQPWHYTWFAFSGERAEQFLRLAGLGRDNPVMDNDRAAAVCEDLYGRITDGSLSGAGSGLTMLSLLFAFFAAFPQAGPAESQRRLYIRKVQNYIARMYQNPFTVEQLADFCGLDRHYLSRIFKAETGFTIKEYILRQKMNRARELLLNSSLSVGNVARSVGYSDVYNFSKIFKKQAGASPLRLRQSRDVQAGSGRRAEKDK